MPADALKMKLRRTTILYWSLLLYVLAALLWWLISLEKQNHRIRAEQLQLLELQARMAKQQSLRLWGSY